MIQHIIVTHLTNNSYMLESAERTARDILIGKQEISDLNISEETKDIISEWKEKVV